MPTSAIAVALSVQVDYFRVRHDQDIILGLQEGLLRCATVLHRFALDPYR